VDRRRRDKTRERGRGGGRGRRGDRSSHSPSTAYTDDYTTESDSERSPSRSPTPQKSRRGNAAVQGPRGSSSGGGAASATATPVPAQGAAVALPRAAPEAPAFASPPLPSSSKLLMRSELESVANSPQATDPSDLRFAVAAGLLSAGEVNPHSTLAGPSAAAAVTSAAAAAASVLHGHSALQPQGLVHPQVQAQLQAQGQALDEAKAQLQQATEANSELQFKLQSVSLERYAAVALGSGVATTSPVALLTVISTAAAPFRRDQLRFEIASLEGRIMMYQSEMISDRNAYRLDVDRLNQVRMSDSVSTPKINF
jgi:hypothetical protein